MLVFGRGQSLNFTVLRFMQNFYLFESDRFALSLLKRRLLSKDEDCRITAKIIPSCLICIEVVSFTLDDKKKGKKIGNRSKEQILEHCHSYNVFEIQHFFQKSDLLQILSLKKNETYTN